MVMESFDQMFEDFISLCIISCTIMQHFSYLLMISLEVVGRYQKHVRSIRSDKRVEKNSEGQCSPTEKI
jgi:hypothetical protein